MRPIADAAAMMFARTLLIGIGATLALQTAAMATAPRPIDAETRLHRCGTETCLLVTGHRTDAAAPVRIADHDVTVQGGRNWHVAVPLDIVRAWSAPFARAIAIQVAGSDGGATQARLPIGLLGHVADLAFLEVRAGH